MGSGASKTAAQSTIRKFPNRAPGSAVPPPPSSSAAAAAAATAAAATAASRSSAPGQNGAAAAAASFSRNQEIREDGSDPHMASQDNMIQPELARRLWEIGVVQPNPTYSHSSTAEPMSSPLQQTPNSGPIFPSPARNPVLTALEARDRLQREVEEEFQSLGLSNSQGRRFLQASMIRDILVMREKGASEAHIENRFNLRKGVLKRLGPRGLYEAAGGAEPAP